MIRSSQGTSSGDESCARPESTPIEERGGATTGTHGQTLSFTLYGEADPVKPARKVMSQIRDASVREQVDVLLSTLRSMLGVVQQIKGNLSHIPPLHASLGDGGSVLIEWIFPDFRVGFNIEPKPDDSGWHLVSNKRLDELTASGHLRDVEEVVVLLLDFIMANV